MATFSIREYALNMREVGGRDLTRSWPFSEKVKKEVAEALLPPIDVRKFRWWSHEVEKLKSKNNWETSELSSEVAEKEEEIKMEKICPVCGVFVTATVNAMNAHIDSCLAQIRSTKEIKGRKNYNKGGGKSSRTPKKRSIAEIFAVAPPVETMIIINHCESEKKVVGKQKIQLKATSLARSLVSAMKTINSNKTKIKYNNNKKNKKNKDFGHEQLCKKGERNHKDVSIHCNKSCFKLLSRQKKQKLVKKSNIVVSKQQRPVPPIRSILKHSTNPSSSNLKGNKQVIDNAGHKSDRRVSFFDKEDVLGPSTRAFTDTFEENAVNPLQASEASTKSGESNEGVDSMEIGVNDDVVSFSTRHDFDSQQLKGKIQLPNIYDQVNAQSSMRPHPCWDKAKHSSVSANRDIPHENNLHLFDHVYVDAPQKLPPVHCSVIPALLAAQEERQYDHVRTQCGSSFPRAHSFYGKSVDHLINPANRVAALGSITSTVPSFGLSENAVGRFLNLAESSANDTRGPVPNWEQNAVSYNEKGPNDEFFCLPLNSKGELIQLNSGLVNRFDQMNEASNNMACSSRIPVCGLVLPRSNRDYFVDNEKLLVDTELTGNQLTLFPLHSTMQENHNRYLSARFDAEPGTSETADIRLLNSERGTESGRFFHSNLMDPSFNRCRYYGKLQNQNGSREIYPENSSGTFVNPARQTMRLMGKDVAVGGNGKEVQEPEVINFWKNSTIIDNCLTNPIQEKPMRKRNFLQDRVFYPASFHGNQVAQSNLLPTAPQVWYPHPHLNRKGGIMYQRSNSAINLNERFNNIHAFSPPSTMTDQAFNMAPNFQQAPFISGPETLRFGNSQPSAFPTSHHICPNRYENSFEQVGYNQSLHPAKLGTFNFPFLQPEDVNHVHLPWFHSSKSLPPWMLHSHQRREEAANSKLTDINGYYYPFASSGTDFLISPSSMHTMPSHLQMKNIPGSTSFFQPIPAAPRVQPPSIRMSSEDRLKFHTLSVKDSDLSSKKIPAAELVDSRKRQKMSSLEMNNSGVVPEWTRGQFTDDMQYHPGTTARVHANWDRAVNSVGNIPNVTQTDGVVISNTNNEAPKVECMARSGPIKLTAGAKHILKPSQSMDVDNTKPTHSTIPSAGLVHSVSLAGSQKKSTKVYSF